MENVGSSDKEIINAFNAKIEELRKESLAIDLCRGKGVSLDKDNDLGHRQMEIEKELSQLKTKSSKSDK